MPKTLTLYQLQQEAATMGEEVSNVNAQYTESLTNNDISLEDRNVLKEHLKDVQDRFTELNKAVKQAKIEQQNHFRKASEGLEQAVDKKTQAYAKVISEVMRGDRTYDQKSFQEALTVSTTQPGGDNNGNGDAFLPINVAAEMISEPFQKNPLRDDASYSQIVNLEIPRISVEYGDSFDAIADGDAAKEVELKGDQVKFDRFKSKVKIGLSETVLAGTNQALVQYVNSALLNGSSQFELSRAFATAPKAGEEHMSFYSAEAGIKKIAGKDLYTGILAALADLDDAYTDNAKIYMTKSDYFNMIGTLANGSATLYQAQPESVLGAPVVFTSRATVPIVGDFSQYHANYDPTTALFEQYKDYDKGINYFQVTLYYDAQIKLASGFRLVDVSGATTTTTTTTTTEKA